MYVTRNECENIDESKEIFTLDLVTLFAYHLL